MTSPPYSLPPLCVFLNIGVIYQPCCYHGPYNKATIHHRPLDVVHLLSVTVVSTETAKDMGADDVEIPQEPRALDPLGKALDGAALVDEFHVQLALALPSWVLVYLAPWFDPAGALAPAVSANQVAKQPHLGARHGRPRAQLDRVPA